MLEGRAHMTFDYAQLNLRVANANRKVLREIGKKVKADAKANVPVKSGQTKQSIGFKTGKDYVRVGTDHFVGRFLESGTPKMRKRPWLRPAFDSNRAFIVRAFAGEL